MTITTVYPPVGGMRANNWHLRQRVPTWSPLEVECHGGAPPVSGQAQCEITAAGLAFSACRRHIQEKKAQGHNEEKWLTE